MTKNDAWMPLYAGDWLRDTMHLTTQEHGAYFLLALAYWVRGEALPDDDRFLANTCKATAKEWKSLRPVMAPFFSVSEGKWWHKRIEAEMANSRDISQKRRVAGASGNAKQAQLRSQMGPQGEALCDVQSQSQSQSPSQSPPPPSSSPAGGGGVGGVGAVPEDAEVFAFGASWPGEPATGTPGPIPVEAVADFLKRMHGRNQFPPRWQRALVSDWRAAFRAGAGVQKKTAPGEVSASVAEVQRSQELAKLRRELREAEEEADAELQAGADMGGWKKANELLRRVKELEGQA